MVKYKENQCIFLCKRLLLKQKEGVCLMEIYIVRHGESIANTLVHKDIPDSALTTKGEEQADKLNEILKTKEITKIYSSPLIRALQTAQPLARSVNLKINVRKELSEHREGSNYIGLKKKELLNKFPEAVFDFKFNKDGWRYKGKNTPRSSMRDSKKILNEIFKLGPQENIVLFAHGTLNFYLIKSLIKAEQSSFEIKQENACINSFTRENGLIRINSICNTSHLRNI